MRLTNALPHTTRLFCLGIWASIKQSCYALRRAVSAAKHRYKERIESHFQLNDSRRMWQGLRTICAFGNKSSAVVSADPSLAEELNTFYGRFDYNGGSAALPISASGSKQAEKRESCDHRDGGRGSEGTKGSEHQESGWTWRDHRPGSEIMRWSACWVVHFYLQRVPCYLCRFPPPLKNPSSSLLPKNNKPSCLNDYRPVALTSIVMKVLRDLLRATLAPPSLLLWTLFSLLIAPIDQLMMPSLTFSTPPSHTLIAAMGTMQDCYS